MYDYVFISDTHLGSKFAQQELLIKFLTEMSPYATNLVLLGDIFDFWRVDNISEYVKIFKSFFPHRLYYCPGNHDSELSFLSLINNNTSKSFTLHSDFGDIFCTHGDILDSRYSEKTFSNYVLDVLIYKLSDSLDLDLRTRFNFLSTYYYHRCAKFYESFSKALRPEIKYVVSGHTHASGRYEFNSKIFYNLGSWFYKPRALVISGKEIAFYEVTENSLLPSRKDFHDYW